MHPDSHISVLRSIAKMCFGHNINIQFSIYMLKSVNHWQGASRYSSLGFFFFPLNTFFSFALAELLRLFGR